MFFPLTYLKVKTNCFLNYCNHTIEIEDMDSVSFYFMRTQTLKTYPINYLTGLKKLLKVNPNFLSDI
jgi:hypothetical protein